MKPLSAKQGLEKKLQLYFKSLNILNYSLLASNYFEDFWALYFAIQSYYCTF